MRRSEEKSFERYRSLHTCRKRFLLTLSLIILRKFVEMTALEKCPIKKPGSPSRTARLQLNTLPKRLGVSLLNRVALFNLIVTVEQYLITGFQVAEYLGGVFSCKAFLDIYQVGFAVISNDYVFVFC